MEGYEGGTNPEVMADPSLVPGRPAPQFEFASRGFYPGWGPAQIWKMPTCRRMSGKQSDAARGQAPVTAGAWRQNVAATRLLDPMNGHFVLGGAPFLLPAFRWPPAPAKPGSCSGPASMPPTAMNQVMRRGSGAHRKGGQQGVSNEAEWLRRWIGKEEPPRPRLPFAEAEVQTDPCEDDFPDGDFSGGIFDCARTA